MKAAPPILWPRDLPLDDAIARSAIGKPILERDHVVGRIVGAYVLEGTAGPRLVIEYDLVDDDRPGWLSVEYGTKIEEIALARFVPKLRVV